MKVALLPGLDGTGRLMAPAVVHAPSSVEPVAISYPADEKRSYAQLEESVPARLPSDCRVLIAESFSGPVAIRLAAAEPDRFSHVILVASFARFPVPGALAPLVQDSVFRGEPPLPLLATFLTGHDAALARRVAEVNRIVEPRVLAHRIREVLRIDTRDELRRCAARILCLRAAHDRLVPRTCAAEIRRLAPRATLLDVPGPHLLLQASPRPCWRAVSRFVG